MPYTCQGVSTWTGSLTGVATFLIKGRSNIPTGDAAGTIDETFTGLYAATDTFGTIHFLERFTINGADNTLHVIARAAGATGAFAGATGVVTFDAYALSLAVDYGGYAGRLCLPKIAHC